MSSLDHDRLLDESQKAARPGAETEVPKPGRTRRSSHEKAAGERPRTTHASASAKAAPAKAAPGERTAPIEAPAPRTAAETPAETAPAPAPVAVAVELAADAGLAGARSVPGRRLRLGTPPLRRPAVLLAAGLVGALSVGLVTAVNDRAAASAAGESRSVGVAHALGLTAATHTAAPAAAATELRMVAASRAQRQAEQTAAAQAQAAADQAALEAARPKAVNPAPGTVLTTCFCMRWGTMHWGIDLAAPLGTPEYAAMDGVVVEAGPASGFGQAVYIRHADGDVTVYGHMEKILVTTGQVVHAGEEIALMGAEGEATGPHLHFEVHAGGIQGQKVDPIAWLRERGVQI